MLTFARQTFLPRIAVCRLMRIFAATLKNMDNPIKKV